MNNSNSLIEVAQVGRLVGLKGELKLHLHCDFPEQFKKGKTFYTAKHETLEVFSYNVARGLIVFVGYQNRDAAAKLVNTLLFTTEEKSQKECHLEEGEYFWFEMIGSRVMDEGMCLGVVDEIERIAGCNYLVVHTDEALIKAGHAKSFLIPYIERYILSFDKERKEILSQDGLGLLENS